MQTSQIEAEINSDWQKKSDKLLAAAAEKHSRALTSVKEEKEELEAQIQELEKRVTMIFNKLFFLKNIIQLTRSCWFADVTVKLHFRLEYTFAAPK